MPSTPPPSFDLTPHPRILQMLGEIVLPQWKCVAELVDNSIDSFIEARRAGRPVQNPLVVVSIPTDRASASRISVRDNGPGMYAQTLELAARAGWTSHDPINNLGLFGMGFNISTARLGLRSTIWTTMAGQPEWVGVEIDAEKLVRRQSFITPALTRPKPNQDLSGTEVIVERLKPDQLEWFSRQYNRSNLARQLGRIYSSMLGPAAGPIGFRLEVNGNQVRPKLHCIWGGPGNPERTVETARQGAINAFQQIEVTLGDRPFCTQCWNWLGAHETSCPSCENSGVIVQRQRRVHGWIGIQRYLDRNDYGIDILRNGRKIEIGNKDLFQWVDESTGAAETEYPIDDPRDRGRIVGEIHLDHCRVPYTKDRFVREDSAWTEMVQIVRGTTPLRPEIAERMGGGENVSPLYRLFQAFRRSNPHNRRAGGWNRLLVIPDNDRALEMAKRFDAGENDYLTDGKWWELAEEADAEALQGGGGALAPGGANPPGGGVLGGPPAPPPGATAGPAPAPPAPTPPRTSISSLSHQYVDDLSGQRYDVEAFAVEPQDPAIAGTRCPWSIQRTTAGPWEFYVDLSAPAFRSVTLTLLDALLTQLSWLIADFERGQGSRWKFGEILMSLRNKYATASLLNAQNLVSEAAAQLVDIARSVIGRISVEDARSFFDGLSPSRQESIRVAMASRAVSNPHGAIADGRFLQYAGPGVIAAFVTSNPTLFLDGNYWDEPYATVDYGSSVATDEGRARILGHYASLLADAVWLAQQSPTDLETMSRERLMRASLATALLAPTATRATTA